MLNLKNLLVWPNVVLFVRKLRISEMYNREKVKKQPEGFDIIYNRIPGKH